MKKHTYVKELEVPLYGTQFIIVLSNDSKEVSKKLPQMEDEGLFAHAIHTNWKGLRGFVMILNFDWKYAKITNGTISHEALHIANMISDAMGVQPDFNNDEPLAYLTEWIVNEVYRFINDNKMVVTL
jgi:hypothetical protein